VEPPEPSTDGTPVDVGEGSGAFDRAVATLTPAQVRAVSTPSAALTVLAGAGSGKTRVLTLRAARRIRDGTAEADHTLICTFTRRAAHELRHRLRGYGVTVSTPAPVGGVPTPGVRAGTLHQLALVLLRRHALDTGAAPPVVAAHRHRTVAGMLHDPTEAAILEAEIGWAKARGLDPSAYRATAAAHDRRVPGGVEQAAETYEAYELSLRRRRMVDLDDLLLRSADLLDADAGFAERARWRYRHLSVDEFQDVNPAQFRLIRALVGDRDDLCAVGDPQQAIYGWNGADPGLLDRLPEVVPAMEVVRLDENHRSTPQVVAAAWAARGRPGDPPPRSTVADGPRPVVTSYRDDRSEAEGVAARILARSADGVPWSDQAVLARTHDQLGVVGQALSAAGIPHRVAPGPTSPTDGGDGDRVELATFHRAKGLEWASVDVVGVEDGFVPIVHAVGGAERDEERRLLYVALTRAATDLHCSWARSRTTASGRTVERRPSPWLEAVARLSRDGDGRTPPPVAARRIAGLRAALEG
jgi:DNA helicase-2/ATP-dependent DNA helicase PcrA